MHLVRKTPTRPYEVRRASRRRPKPRPHAWRCVPNGRQPKKKPSQLLQACSSAWTKLVMPANICAPCATRHHCGSLSMKRPSSRGSGALSSNRPAPPMPRPGPSLRSKCIGQSSRGLVVNPTSSSIIGMGPDARAFASALSSRRRLADVRPLPVSGASPGAAAVACRCNAERPTACPPSPRAQGRGRSGNASGSSPRSRTALPTRRARTVSREHTRLDQRNNDVQNVTQQTLELRLLTSPQTLKRTDHRQPVT